MKRRDFVAVSSLGAVAATPESWAGTQAAAAHDPGAHGDAGAGDVGLHKPDLILTHWKDELTYPTHWRTSRSVIEAAQIARVSWDIRFFEPNIGTASRVGFVPDHYVDITAVFERKVEALKTLAAQPRLVSDYTACNRWRGLECGRQYAEAFVRWAPKPPVYDVLTLPGTANGYTL